MGIERKPTRYAHSSGHTDVCYSQNGEKLITCGTDGDIRIWSGFDDYDPVQTCVGEWSLCVRQKNGHIQIGTDNNIVQLLTYPQGERDGILTRFTAHVNHMAVGKEHDLIAVAAEDMEVKVINLSDPKESNSNLSFSGLTGAPLSVALCPKAKILAVSSGDGCLRLWDVETQNVLKEFNCVPKTNSFMNAKLLCRMDFDPSFTRYLAYPEKNTVVIVNTSNWSIKTTLTCDAVQTSYSIVQFSPCGNFIAAASDKGDLVVWEVSSQMLVDVTNHPASTAICAMVWNPSGNGEIAFCDVQGQLGIATNCTNSSIPSDTNEVKEAENEVDFGDMEFVDDDDEDNENAVSLEKLKKDIMGTSEPELDFDKESSAPSPRPRTPEVPLQEPFMPSSTPEHLNPRYLCWNEVGIVRSYGSASEDQESPKSIEVEFHDSTFHNSMMMQNFLGYTMGSLSVSALAVANANQIAVLPLSSGTKEWNFSVDEEVNIICIAASQNLICVATSNYLVHICATYGTQKAVISVPGPIVTMSSFGYLLLIAYHAASARKDDQCVNMMLVRLEGTTVVNRNIKGALGPECTLFWLGFSDTGTPAVYDSSGMLFLFPLDSNIWLPFCDTTKHRKSPADGYFVTAVFESLQALRGIRCKGANYPGFTPRPTLSELPLQPSFVEMTTEKSQLEAGLFALSVLQVENMEKKYKETALKTFALACKNNLDQRALEFVEMLADPQIMMLAVKYATKLDRRRLAEKLIEMASKLKDDEDVTLNDISVSTPTGVIKPNRKLVLHSSSKGTSKYKSTSEQTSTPVNTSGHISRSENASLSTTTNNPDNSVLSLSTVDSRSETPSNTQDSLLSEKEPRNPFLKNLKKPKSATYNPLSLTDRFAGFDAEKKEKENKNSNEGSEKRKEPDTPSENDKQKEKQRKLDQFMFSKRK